MIFLPFGQVIDDHRLLVEPAVNVCWTYCRPSGGVLQNAIAVILQLAVVPSAS